MALGVYTVALLAALSVGPALPLRLHPPNGMAAAVLVPVSTTFMYLLAVFSFGLDGDVAARRSIFPTRLFTLPVTTPALAGWPMLFGSVAAASLWLVAAAFIRWWWGAPLPAIWPAVLAAVFLSWTQAVTWMPYGLPGLRVVVAIALLAALDAVVILATHYEVAETRMVALLAPQLPVAYLVACFAVARARRGDVPDWRGLFARRTRTPSVRSFGLFASASRAQVWFEWRQHGRVLPALVAMLLPFELGLLWLARHEPPVLVYLTLLAVLLTPPFMAGFIAATASRSVREGRDADGATLAATRPLTTPALVAARMWMALWSALLAWLQVLVAVPLALTLTGTAPVVLERAAEIALVLGRPRALVLALLAFFGLIASTWKQLAQGLYIGLTGSPAAIRGSVLARLSLLVVLGPALDHVARNGSVQAWLWDYWIWGLAVLVVLKMSLALAWIVPRLHRSRLLRDRSLVTGAAGWLVAVLALHGVLVWLVATPEHIPRYLCALVAILAVPLVRLSAAPLALDWGRHGGSAAREPDREVAGASPLLAARVLLVVPMVLATIEAVSFEVRNRTNGTLVSSGRPREYLLHVPRSYDRSRPTALVISMHGAAMLPAAQRDASLWSALADREGFLVVYPSGETGRGPRHWNASRSPTGLARDVRFIGDLIDTLSADYDIDPARIYADGLSNGGGMAFVLSCTLADRIAAVGMVASAQLLPFDWCPDPRPVPMIAFHGTADRATPYHGGSSWAARAPFPSIPGFTADWARRNRCGPDPVETAMALDVTRRAYSNCADAAAVELYTIEGGGHTWPGGGPMPGWFVGATSHSIDATRLTWTFFQQHPLPAARRSAGE